MLNGVGGVVVDGVHSHLHWTAGCPLDLRRGPCLLCLFLVWSRSGPDTIYIYILYIRQVQYKLIHCSTR